MFILLKKKDFKRSFSSTETENKEYSSNGNYLYECIVITY